MIRQSSYIMCKWYVLAEKLENGVKTQRRKVEAVFLGELDNRNKSLQNIKLFR